VNTKYLILPTHLIAQVRDLATERECSPEQILVEQFERIEGNPGLKAEVVMAAGRIIAAMGRRERTEDLWPSQLLDAVCVAIALAEMLDQCAEVVLLGMSEGQLETVDQLSRSTGRDLDELMVEELLSWPQNRPLPPPN
jgi:hypothetical protein